MCSEGLGAVRKQQRAFLGAAPRLCAHLTGGGGAACCFKSPFSPVLCLGRTHTSGMRLKAALSAEPIITRQLLQPAPFSHFSSVSSPPSSLPLHPRVGISEPQPGNLTHLDSTQGCSSGRKSVKSHNREAMETNAHNILNWHRNLMLTSPAVHLPWSMINTTRFPSRDSAEVLALSWKDGLAKFNVPKCRNENSVPSSAITSGRAAGLGSTFCSSPACEAETGQQSIYLARGAVG